MAEAMLKRSGEVRRLGVHLGMLEWLMWGVMNKRRVHLLYGPNVNDIVLLYGVASEVEVLQWPVAAVAAVQIQPDTGSWLAPVGNSQVVNHFVIGRSDPGLVSDPALPLIVVWESVLIKRQAAWVGACMSP